MLFDISYKTDFESVLLWWAWRYLFFVFWFLFFRYSEIKINDLKKYFEKTAHQFFTAWIIEIFYHLIFYIKKRINFISISFIIKYFCLKRYNNKRISVLPYKFRLFVYIFFQHSSSFSLNWVLFIGIENIHLEITIFYWFSFTKITYFCTPKNEHSKRFSYSPTPQTIKLRKYQTKLFYPLPHRDSNWLIICQFV